MYMAPSLSKHISFAWWDKCNRSEYIIQTIPQNIYNYFRTANMGIFDKMQANFQDQVKKE